MARFNTIIQKIEQKCPNDWWIMSFKKKAREDHPCYQLYKKTIREYNKALNCLDPRSFSILSDKVLSEFKCEAVQNEDGRGKQLSFDLMNEAFAYKYLQSRVVNNLCFVEENRDMANNQSETPDIRFEEKGRVGYCEVKTINRPDKDKKRDECKVFSGSEYDPKDGFFNTLRDALDTAKSQVKTPSDSEFGIVYLIINFDDFTLEDHTTYKEQLHVFFQQSYPDIEIHALIPGGGFHALYEIHHTPDL